MSVVKSEGSIIIGIAMSDSASMAEVSVKLTT